MNEQNIQGNGNVTVNFSGQFILSREVLEELAGRLKTSEVPTVLQKGSVSRVVDEGKLPRLAYSIKETAEILGVSYSSVYKLIHRGLIRSSGALRHTLIPKKEIERFLATTLSEG